MRRITCTVALLLCGACQPQAKAAAPVRIASAPTADCPEPTGIPNPGTHPVRPIHRVFIDLDSKKDWLAFFDDYKVDEVVIQNIIGKPYDKRDEALEVLKAAGTRGIRVYVGLVYEDKFNSDTMSATALEIAAQEDIDTAKAFVQMAGALENQIAGWYLAREIHNFRDTVRDSLGRSQHSLVRGYLEKVTLGLPPRPRVLISPYFVPPVPQRPELVGIDETATFFAYLVQGTGVTDVLLQDGTGARNDPLKNLGCTWPLDSYLRVAAAYANAVEARLRPGVTFWSNVEVFGDDATPDRVRKQLATIPPGRPLIAFAYRGCGPMGACEPRRP
ncbi:MAG TPA: DUF4434 domain-containing protein [Longimicrobium sp.]|jgi:hypothetical protein|nr:DUF4434 domain-containing protein [Longimicrobium sp.]